jgi:snoRNA binding domain-containing protein (fibrillarin)
LRPEDLPSPLAQMLESLPPADRVVAADAKLEAAVTRRTRRDIARASVAELRAARATLAQTPRPDDRRFVVALARSALERAMRSPEEVLIALAREEERVERALGREQRAAATFVPVPGTELAGYVPGWEAAREALTEHHRRLVSTVERLARELLPNLSDVVGERVAARLLAAAGSVAALGRMPGARIQVLGARRRPAADRGPRYGILYRGARMGDVPADRRAAYARSLAALAAIAVRADATTRSRIGTILVARRDRRIERLRRRTR